MRIVIILSGLNHATLDDAVVKVLTGIPEAEYSHATIEVLPVDADDYGTRMMVRRVTIFEPKEKAIRSLAKIDVPHNINIFLR